MTTAVQARKSSSALKKRVRTISHAPGKARRNPKPHEVSKAALGKEGLLDAVANAQTALGYVDLKQAIRAALTAFSDFYPSLNNANVMLEEVEEADDGTGWLITIGYDSKQKITGVQAMFGGYQDCRSYKSFKIDRRTGRLLHMKIRSVN